MHIFSSSAEGHHLLLDLYGDVAVLKNKTCHAHLSIVLFFDALIAIREDYGTARTELLESR